MVTLLLIHLFLLKLFCGYFYNRSTLAAPLESQICPLTPEDEEMARIYEDRVYHPQDIIERHGGLTEIRYILRQVDLLLCH